MFLITVLIFFGIVGLAVSLGMKMWVRPKEALERVAGSFEAGASHPVEHPSLAFHEVIKRLGQGACSVALLVSMLWR